MSGVSTGGGGTGSATELGFAGDCYGAGWDWENVTGLSDDDTIKRLREVQRKIIGIARLP